MRSVALPSNWEPLKILLNATFRNFRFTLIATFNWSPLNRLLSIQSLYDLMNTGGCGSLKCVRATWKLWPTAWPALWRCRMAQRQWAERAIPIRSPLCDAADGCLRAVLDECSVKLFSQFSPSFFWRHSERHTEVGVVVPFSSGGGLRKCDVFSRMSLARPVLSEFVANGLAPEVHAGERPSHHWRAPTTERRI